MKILNDTRRPLIALCLVATALWASGCASTLPRTARQVEAGDIVLSGHVDEPGSLVIPRVSGQLMYGLGPGDLSVHAGTSYFGVNAGLGAAAYLGPRWMATFYADAELQWVTNVIDSGSIFKYTGALRLITAARKKNALYGGFELGGLAFSQGNDALPPSLVGGGVAGFDALLRDNFGVQIEAKLTPFHFTPRLGVGFLLSNDSEASLIVGQLGFSFYKRWPAREEIEPSQGTPIQWTVPDARPRLPTGTVPPQQSDPQPRREAPPRRTAPKQDQGGGLAPVPPPPE